MIKRIFKWKRGIIPFIAAIFLIGATLAFAGTAKTFLYGLKMKDQTAPGTPPSGYGYLYVNSDILYFKTDGGLATDLISAAGTATDFELAADADAGDFDIDSLDRLEFVDNGLYIDGGTDATLLISSDGTLEIATADWDISTTGTITKASMSADQISAAALTLGNNYLSIGTDPADAGTIRLPNAGTIVFEKAVTGTDISAFTVTSGDIVQIGASGSSGCTITPALTLSSTLALGGDVTVGAHELTGTTGLINYTHFDVDAAGAVTCTALDAGSGTIETTGDITSGGTITGVTIAQDTIIASTADTALTLDGSATTGGVSIGTAGGNGTITMGGSGYSTLVNLPSAVDLTMAGGQLSITDAYNGDLVTLVNNTLTTADAIDITAGGTRTAGNIIKIADSATTATTIAIVANAQTNGHGISYTNTGADLSGAGLYLAITDGANFDGDYIKCYDGSGEDFTVERYGETTIAGNASGTDALTISAGDILVSTGHIDITTGNMTVGTGNVAISTAGDISTAKGKLTVDSVDDDSSHIKRNKSGISTVLFEIEKTNASDTGTVLLIENSGTGAGVTLDMDVKGTGQVIDIDAAATHTGDVINIDMANQLAEKAIDIGTADAWTGTAGEGMIDLHSTGQVVATASLLRIVNDTAQADDGSDGYCINVDDDTTVATTPTVYAVLINSDANAALHVSKGASLFADLTSHTNGINVDEDVDIDWNNADEEMNITNTAEYANDGAMLTLYNSDADLTTGLTDEMFLIRGRYKDQACDYGGFLIFEDNDGDDQFMIDADGATTITGNASGTDALTLTAGDILVTAGNIDITTGNFQTDNGHAAIGIGTADIETWETSTQLSVVQLGGAGFWAAARVQAAGDSSYLGHNAYFDDTNSQWEAMSTVADDEAVMLEMTDGTWCFNVEDTALADDQPITWIDALRISNAGKVGIGPATAATIDELLHLESDTASKPVVKIENTNADGNGAIVELTKDSASPADDDVIGIIEFRGEGDTSTETLFANITAMSSDVTEAGSATGGQLDFDVIITNASSTVLSLGGQDTANSTPAEVVINEDTGDVDFRVESDASERAFFVQGSSGDIILQKQVADFAIVNATSIGEIQFFGDDDTSSADHIAGQIEVIARTTWSDTAEDADMVLNVANGGTLNANQLVLDTEGHVAFGTATPDEQVHLYSTTASKPVLKIENVQADANGPVLELKKLSSSPADDDVLGIIEFRGIGDGASNEFLYANITAISSDVTEAGSADAGQLDFDVYVAGSTSTILSLGGEDTANASPAEVVINEDTADVDFRVESDGYEKALFVEGSTGEVSGDPWNDQRSYILAGEILEDATTPPLILAWIAPATTEVDLSGAGNNATYSNFATTDQIAKGMVWALSFYDGNNEYLTVGDDAAFSWDDTGANPWSVCFWIEVVETAAIQTVIAKYDVQGTDREFKIVLDAAEKMELALFDEADDKEATNITDAALSAGWHFVVHTYDSTGGATALSDTNSVWYVDGVAVAESQTNDAQYTGMVGGATDVTIGGYDTGAAVANFFQGDMGILWIEDVELSAATVWMYYMKTRGFYNK